MGGILLQSSKHKRFLHVHLYAASHITMLHTCCCISSRDLQHCLQALQGCMLTSLEGRQHIDLSWFVRR